MNDNITIDPLARATAVAHPEICEIRSLKSGLVLDSVRYIESVRYDRLVQVRTAIKEAIEINKPRVVCALCGTPIYLVASPEKNFFFRHRVEDGSCPAQTRSELTREAVRAIKYNGAKESAAHLRLKGLIERSLLADSRFEDVATERTWFGKRDLTAYRRPDVQARIGEQRFAFEAQLTTTFLDVVIGRKSFYRGEGALLIWVLPYFDPAYRRLTIDDLLFNNNTNVLVVNGESAAASEENASLTLWCYFRRVELVGTSIESRWDRHLVAWDELTLDWAGQRSYYFDCEGIERKLTEKRRTLLNEENERKIATVKLAKLKQDDELRASFFNALATEIDSTNAAETRERWQALQYSFARRGFELAGQYGPGGSLRNLTYAILSAKAGKPLGYKFEKLIQVAHHLHDNFPEALLPFGYALREAKNEDILKLEDKQGRWGAKSIHIRERIKAGDNAFKLEPATISLLAFLFPDSKVWLGYLPK